MNRKRIISCPVVTMPIIDAGAKKKEEDKTEQPHILCKLTYNKPDICRESLEGKNALGGRRFDVILQPYEGNN